MNHTHFDALQLYLEDADSMSVITQKRGRVYSCCAEDLYVIIIIFIYSCVCYGITNFCSILLVAHGSTRVDIGGGGLCGRRDLSVLVLLVKSRNHPAH